MPVRAVFLDVGETLVYAHPSSAEIIAGICAAAGFPITPDQVEAAERKVWPLAQRRQREQPLYSISAENSQRFWTGFYSLLMAELPVPEGSGGDLAHLMHERFNTLDTWRLFPDA